MNPTKAHPKRGDPVVWLAQRSLRRIPNTNLPAYDLRPAAKFGKIREVMDEDARNHQIMRLYQCALGALQGFVASRDYLLLLGGPNSIAITFYVAMSIAREQSARYIRVLSWDRANETYVSRSLPVFLEDVV